MPPMPNPLTPSPEAVEAAYLTEYVSRAVVERLLTAAMPALTAQIVEACVEAVGRDTKLAIDVGRMTGVPATPVEMREIALAALRALLPAPTPAPEIPGGDV